MSNVAVPPPTRKTPKPRTAAKRQRVAADLRDLVQSLSPGDRLPSTFHLEERFGVATGTIEAAVRDLRAAGLVETRPGSGTYVSARSPQPPGNVTASPDAGIPGVGTIAVFAGSTTPFYRDCVRRIVAISSQQNLAVECRFTDHPMTLEDLSRFEERRPAGFLIIGNESAWIAEAAQERGWPVVVIGEPQIGEVPRVPSVYSDAEQGGYLATRRLLDLGHRRVAYLNRMSDAVLHSKRRWQGHERALREAGLSLEEAERNGIDSARLEAWKLNPADAQGWFARSDAPTGVVAWSDPAAAMLLSVLRRAGVRVPEEVSLVGYDNLPEGEYAFPALDTVDQHLDVLIRHALLLLSLPVPQPTVSTALVAPTLVCRESAGPPRPHALVGETMPNASN
jgi:DNA-binding LacI/PurR family transcriptional regulator